MSDAFLSLQDFEAAGRRIAGRVHRTPTLSATTLGEDLGLRLSFKAELFQKTGSFKIRGVLNTLSILADEDPAALSRGLVSMSAGNHAAALAYGARQVGARATIVMPKRAVQSKIDATEAYGGEVVLTERDLMEVVGELQRDRGLTLVHPFDDPRIMAGHGTAGLEIAEDVPDVDTVFEIGGQDSKYIAVREGRLTDFEMNKICAAGTGSFLEEQAERLDIHIVREFGERALRSTAPTSLGERCTVFMESDLNHHQQQGAPKDDLVAGLAYSIVLNYLNRVVEGRRVGDRIFFQGGVAANRAVVAAFQAVTGKTITVPPHHDVLGAVGAALIARELCTGPSQFKGFDLTDRRYTVDAFECECLGIHTARQTVSAREENMSAWAGQSSMSKWVNF